MMGEWSGGHYGSWGRSEARWFGERGFEAWSLEYGESLGMGWLRSRRDG